MTNKWINLNEKCVAILLNCESWLGGIIFINLIRGQEINHDCVIIVTSAPSKEQFLL